MSVTNIAAAVEAAVRPHTCQCDCRRWAHEAWKVCESNAPKGRLVRLYFDDTADPRGVYPRDVCLPCAEHIKSARARGGEVLAPEGTQPASEA